jgi:hypothetical protein
MTRACLLLFILAASFASPSSAQSRGADDVAEVVDLARRGSYADALKAADSLSSPVACAQGRLFVFHQAGALGAALQAGIAGLRESPADLWLLERVCYIAISLRATPIAREYCDRFARVANAAEARESAGESKWRELAADDLSQVDELEMAANARSNALLRARATVYATALLFGALLLTALRRVRIDVERNATRRDA